MKDADQALEWLRSNLTLDSSDQESSLLIAKALEQKGDMEQSVVRYRRLLEGDPTCLDAYHGLNRLMRLLATPSVAAAALAALEFQGGASPSDQQRLDHLDDEPPPGGTLDVIRMPGDADFHGIRQVFSLVLPCFGALYPTQQSQVLRPSDPAALAAGQLASALGLPGVQVSVEGSAAALSGVGDPVPLRISTEHTGEENPCGNTASCISPPPSHCLPAR